MNISLELVFKGPVNNISALGHTMSLHRNGNKPLFEEMMT